MTDIKYLPSYEEVTKSCPPPPPYVSRVPSLVDCSTAYRFNNHGQTLTCAPSNRNVRVNNKPKHWMKRPCFVVFTYSLAIFSCLFCGCFFGLLALLFLYLGDKNSNALDSGPDENKCQKRFIFPFVSIFLSVIGIFIGILLLAICLSIAHSRSLHECRNGHSANGTCCDRIASCDRRLVRIGKDGCKYCCTTKQCYNLLKEMSGCPKCQIYSEENDWNGCPHCCENNMSNSCGSWGKYRDSFGCEKCCHSFSEEECSRHEISFSGGCKMCCPSCQVNSTLKYDSGCFRCCSKIEQCEGDTYLDENGCQQCCKPHLKNCSFYSLNYKIEICRQCCNNPPLYICSYQGSKQ